MKIIVTGGAGFIGSHVVDRYLELGHEIAVIDNLVTGRKEFVNRQAKFYREDITAGKIAEIFDREKPDIVNHHAAQIDIRKSVQDPAGDAHVNVVGSLNVIQNCIKYKVKKIIFASSGGAVYGDPAKLPVDENYLTRPLSPYGAAKLAVEQYLYAMKSYAGMDYTILRYGNVYGPRQNPLGEAGVCAIFAGKMSRKEKCTLYGNGKPLRDYVFVGDIARANVKALEKGGGEIYNLGTNKGTSVQQIFEIMKRLSGYGQEPELKPLRTGELQKIFLDCTKARKDLKWTASMDLEEGLKETIRSLASNNGAI